jgi:hypothetical protein
VDWGRVRAQVACLHTRLATARPGRGGAGSHDAGARKHHERGGEPDAGKMGGEPSQGKKEKEMGPTQRNNASFELIQKFKLTRFDLIKRGIAEFKKFQIKYSCEGFEVRNKCFYRNFLRFRLYFELNFKGASRV